MLGLFAYIALLWFVMPALLLRVARLIDKYTRETPGFIGFPLDSEAVRAEWEAEFQARSGQKIVRFPSV